MLYICTHLSESYLQQVNSTSLKHKYTMFQKAIHTMYVPFDIFFCCHLTFESTFFFETAPYYTKIVELCLFARESTKVNCFCCLCPKVRKSQLLAATRARAPIQLGVAVFCARQVEISRTQQRSCLKQSLFEEFQLKQLTNK